MPELKAVAFRGLSVDDGHEARTREHLAGALPMSMKPAAFVVPFVQVAGPESLAYIGPGLGLSTLLLLAGLALTIFVALMALVWFPLKRAYRRLRARSQKSARTDCDHGDDDVSG